MKIHYALAFAGTLFLGIPKIINAQNKFINKTPTSDLFVKTQISPKGTSDLNILSKAPSPKLDVAGKFINATFVIELSKNVLYHYDENGNPISAYSIAKGKPSTPTHTGVRIVSHVETYPYRHAPRHTKRRRNPGAYGPNVIILDNLDTKTGERSSIGEFIHGTNNPSSIGKDVSHGCMRMDNEVIKKLAKMVKRGNIVIIR